VSPRREGRRIRLGLVSGDGLPVSGLLTIFRNVVDLGVRHGIVDGRVAADLGYSWRPDKTGFFPAGDAGTGYPPWLSVTSWHPARARQDPAARAQALTRIRRAAAAGQDDAATARAAGEIEAEYHGHFLSWMTEHEVDWVIAVNMTLTDAVPVSRALASAAAQRFSGQPGGVLYWDHDLLGSCGIIDPGTGRRYYPAAPNLWTPIPAARRHNRWAVVSPGLRDEAEGYPTALEPRLVPSVLPCEPDAQLGERHYSFAGQQGLDLQAPVLLSPVRVFSVKGVEITVALAARLARLLQARGERQPQLLVFGSLREEPAYARRVVKAAADLGIGDQVRFLDGVPLASHRAADGAWRLDEVDLLALASATGGAVLFTPSVQDVETIGLGPALAALAGIPCAVTPYEAYDAFYRGALSDVRAHPGEEGISAAAEELLSLMTGRARRDPAVLSRLKSNHAALGDLFPVRPWLDLLQDLRSEFGPLPGGESPGGPGIPETRRQAG
jgi:hypothetical protein